MPARTPIVIAVVAAAALVGCSSTSGATEPGSADAVEIDNCGFAATFESPPTAVVTIKSSTTEALVALGLEDVIVGTAFQDGPLPDALQVEAALPVIDDEMPSAEAVLEAEPDLVFSGWESAFAADAIGTRDELAELGVGTYVWPAACMSEDVPESVTFDTIATSIDELATIFDVDAQPVLDAQQATLEGIEPDDADRTALWWSSGGTDSPYVGAGDGAPELIMETAGLANVAGDLDGGWATYSWESVVEADPDVLVLVDSAWSTAEHKIDYLESDPALSQLSAVRSGSYVIVPFAASEAGVRTAEAAASVAEQLAALD